MPDTSCTSSFGCNPDSISNLVVSGTLVYTLLVTGGSGEPTIISTAAMTVLYKGKTNNIVKGTQIMYGLIIP